MAKPSLKATQNGIQLAKQALTIAGWTQRDLSTQVGCSRQPITNFFKGEAIAQPIFIQICDRLNLNWQEIAGLSLHSAEPASATPVPTHSKWRHSSAKIAPSGPIPKYQIPLHQRNFNASAKPHISLGEAPNLSMFYGREDELNKLRKVILEDRFQLVALLGMRGIGKTTLATKLIEEIAEEFEFVIWRSLDYNPPPYLLNLLADVITFLSNQPRTHLPETPDERISLLLEYLRQHHCLLVLDNAESLMRDRSLAGQYQTDYEEYGELLRRIGTERHQSCLVFTSRENPQEITELEARDLPVHTLTLSGLPESDAVQLLAAKGLSDQKHWGLLIEIFQGNPLALQIVAATIQRSFGGRVADFLKQKTITARQLVDLLDQQMAGLSLLEREIMYWLTIHPQPMSFADLKQTIEISGAELLDALESLLRRSLIQGEADFTLESVVRQYVENEFKQEKLSLEMPQAKDNIRHLLERCFDQT
jgi:transcriptional regulator with XRE-family HTH domain